MQQILRSVDEYYPDIAPQIHRIQNSEKVDNFKTIQGSLFTIGSHINSESKDIFEEIPTKNYDELLTNIRWINSEETLFEIEKVVNDYYPLIVEDAKDIRGIVVLLIKEICQSHVNNIVFKAKENAFKGFPNKVLKHISLQLLKVQDEHLTKIANDIERGVMLYTLLIAGVLIKNVSGWHSEEFRTIYHTKSNAIISALSNYEFADELFNSLIKSGTLCNEEDMTSTNYAPIEIAFLKRSQLLPKLFEKIYEDKMKHYQEIGLTDAKADFREGGKSTVQCHKCRGFYTDYIQLQTRSADEPMTIFYRCRECGNRGRR
jgi:DNA-directed RNA polymerase subunit M/transcription elongation factor TFIIS